MARLSAVVVIVSPLLVVANVLLYGNGFVSIATVLSLLGLSSLILILRLTGSLRWTGAAFILFELGPLIAIAARWQGATSIALTWAGFGLALGTLIGGPGVGAFGAGSLSLALVGMYLAERQGLIDPAAIDPEVAERGALFNLVVLASMTVVLMTLVLREQARASAAARSASDELRAAERSALRNERLASVGLLAAGVAHEINNPLTYVQGNLELLSAELDEIGVSKDAREAVRDALDGARRVGEIVRQLRVFSRGETGPPVAVDLREALETAVRWLEAPLRGVELELRLRSAGPVVGVTGQIVQVLVHLLQNAAQATEGRGRVEVVSYDSGPGELTVEVADDGPGVAPDIRDRVFDPFFSTKPVGTASGLGLSVAHGIATSLGGRLEIATSDGRGARFRLVLPRAEPARSSTLVAAVRSARSVVPVTRPGGGGDVHPPPPSSAPEAKKTLPPS